MYNNLINSLKKILDDKSTQAEKLLKIKTLVDFAEGLEQPRWTPQPQTPQPQMPAQAQPLQQSKPAGGPGAIVGVEDIK